MQTREKIEFILSGKSDNKTIHEVFEDLNNHSSKKRFELLNVDDPLVFRFYFYVVKNYPDLKQKADEFLAQDIRAFHELLSKNVKTFDYHITFCKHYLTNVLDALPTNSAARRNYRDLVAARCALEKETEKLVTELYPAKLGDTHTVIELISEKKSQAVALSKMCKRKFSIAHEMIQAARTDSTVNLKSLLMELDKINQFIPDESDTNPLTKYVYYRALLAALSSGSFHCADMLLETGIDINGAKEINLLKSAAMNYSVEAVGYLLEKGANEVDVPNLRVLSVNDDREFANYMLIYESLKPNKCLNIVNDSYMLGTDHAKDVKNRVYYFIKAQPLERRIKLCEQAFDPNTYIGSIMHLQRGNKKASKDHGTLWWIDKRIYQPALRERGVAPTVPDIAAQSPKKDKEEMGQIHGAGQNVQAIDMPASFETVSTIIETYSKLTHVIDAIDVDNTKTNIKDLISIKPQSIGEVINCLRTKVYVKNQNEPVSLAQLLASKKYIATVEENLLQLLTAIVRTGPKNANEIADIILEDPITIIFRMFTGDNSSQHMQLFDDLIEHADTKAASILLNIAPGFIENRYPNTLPLNYARSLSNEDIQHFIASLEKLALKSKAAARKVYNILSHTASTVPGEQNKWNFGKTVARHQDTQSFLALIQLLEKLAENGISQEEIQTLLPTGIDWFDDKQKGRDTKLNLLNIIKELPVNERIAMCEKALDPNHPLGHTMHLKRGNDECRPGHGTLGKIEKVMQQAIAQREQANRMIELDNHDGSVNPLWIAARDNQSDALKIQIEAGANLEIQDRRGLAALHLAASQGSTTAINLLLDAGADINSRSLTKGWTPLFAATFFGHYQAVKLLLNRGANPDLTQYHDLTSPLFLAAQSGYQECVAALLKSNADINSPFNVHIKAFQQMINKHANSDPTVMEKSRILLERADEDGYIYITAAEIARVMGHDNIAEMIESYDAKHKVTVIPTEGEALNPIIPTEGEALNPVIPTEGEALNPVIPTEGEARVEGSPELTAEDIANHPYLQLGKNVVIEEPLLDDHLESDEVIEIVVDNPAPPSYEEATKDSEQLLIPDLPYPRFFAAKSEQNMFSQEAESEVTVTGDLLLSFEPIKQPDLLTFPESEDLLRFEESQIAEEQLRILDELKVPTGRSSNIGQFGKQGNAAPDEDKKTDIKKPAKTALLN